MSRIIVLSIAMLLFGVAPGRTESSSQGIRVVSARDLLNYAEMPAFREALLDRIKHTENGISWGMVVGEKNLYCTPPNLPLAPEQILTIVARYTKDNPIELDRNWELGNDQRTEGCFSVRRCDARINPAFLTAYLRHDHSHSKSGTVSGGKRLSNDTARSIRTWRDIFTPNSVAFV